ETEIEALATPGCCKRKAFASLTVFRAISFAMFNFWAAVKWYFHFPLAVAFTSIIPSFLSVYLTVCAAPEVTPDIIGSGGTRTTSSVPTCSPVTLVIAVPLGIFTQFGV